MIWILKEENYQVTEYYFKIIQSAAMSICKDVFFVEEFQIDVKNKRTDIIVVGSIIKAIKLYFKGYKNIVVWFQGIVPEESYMRNKSTVKKKVLEIIEVNVLKKCKLAIFVSQEMKNHYENKYKLNLDDKCYIMPCFNTDIQKNSFYKKGKYENNIFAYTGTISSWQGFDKIVNCYEKIEKMNFPNTKLVILTPDKSKADEIIKGTSIKNYEIGYVKTEELPNILSDVKFGFVIRDNNDVNRVSTPTKLSTYIANGLIPIYSDSIKDFHNIIKEYTYKLNFNSQNFYNDIKIFMELDTDCDYIYKEYLSIFREYYNAEFHIKHLSKKIKEIKV